MLAVEPAVVAAIIAGTVTLLIWLLSRMPTFSSEQRLAELIERDLKILEKLPAGEAHDRLSASVEQRVKRLLVARGEGTPSERLTADEQRVRRSNRVGMVYGTVFAGATTVLGIAGVVRVLQVDNSAAAMVFGVTLSGLIAFGSAWVSVVFARVAAGLRDPDRRRR